MADNDTKNSVTVSPRSVKHGFRIADQPLSMSMCYPGRLCPGPDGVAAGRRIEGVGGGLEPACHGPERPRTAGPLRDDAAVGGAEVVAAPGRPDGPLHPPVDLRDEVGHRARPQRDVGPVPAPHVLQRPDY